MDPLSSIRTMVPGLQGMPLPKAAEDATEPPYSEFTPADNTLLDEEDVQAIAEQVWPEDADEDLQD